MEMTAKDSAPATRIRWLIAPLVLLVLLATLATPAAAAIPPAEVIVLLERAGRGHRRRPRHHLLRRRPALGDIFRGDVRRGTAELFIDAPEGRWAVGMAASNAHELLFVAGGATGEGYVYDTASGTTVASYQLADPNAGFINDVTVTKDGAWFTDSLQAQLYFVPVSGAGVPGPARTLALSGPAADTSADFNLNGIAASPNGKTLIVGHSGNGELYTVDPATGESSTIAGVSVRNVDGLLLEAGRLWAVQRRGSTRSPRSACVTTAPGVVEKVITSDLFQTPTLWPASAVAWRW